ncbi:MAG: hypothetical protein HUU15_03610 [Candidatus Brocadiae bacterium]|nr:hypothetical protein [Candidatus Brocadiia bacterium]
MLLVLSVLEAPLVGASVPRICFLVEAVALAGASVAVLRRQPELFNGVALAAALVFVTANALWLAGRPVFQVVPWWAGFVVLTIAAERLELSRVTRPSRAAVGVFLGISLLLGGVLVAQTFRYAEGLRACGGAFLLFAAWLLRYDIARKTIRLKGLTRYIAAGLLSGYLWLAFAGILALAGGAGGLGRDAFYHAIFLGFAMSMIFAHAPVIVPAIAAVPIAWTRAFWLPLGALHGGLIVRVAADLGGEPDLRSWAGFANAASILLFVLVLGRGAWAARVSASGR